MAREQGPASCASSPRRLWVRTDRRLLRRVLQNLLANAIKYTQQRRRAARRAAGAAAQVVVQVSDTGPGIPQGKQSLIFKEFQRLDETAASVRGLGLGLSIVERIGKVLEAPIGLVSVARPRLDFHGDVAGEAAPQAMRGAVRAVVHFAWRRYLRMPGAMHRERASRCWTAWRCCYRAGDAVCCWRTASEQALALLRGAEEQPHIILADYHLDEGTGVEAVAAVRAQIRADVPAVIISADTSVEVQREIRHRGLLHLRKPLKAGACARY